MCIKILNEIQFDCEFNIIGQIEDLNYWKNCSFQIKKLKKNINVKYLGVKSKKGVFSLMRKSHCLLHPSKFESFGHIIFESLSNGLPVIISTNTPWQNLKKKKVGASLSSNIKKFVDEINYLKTCSDKDFLNYRKKLCCMQIKRFKKINFL